MSTTLAARFDGHTGGPRTKKAGGFQILVLPVLSQSWSMGGDAVGLRDQPNLTGG